MTIIQCMVFFFLLPQDADIQLQAPASVPAGSAFEIGWSPGGEARDFITIVIKDAPAGSYKRYAYASTKSWKTIAPDEPGDYEIRFLGAESPYPTLASKTLAVTPVSAEISVANTASAGSVLTVNWTGPNNPKDFITILKAESPARKYAKYAYTKAGSPLTLKVPDEPGSYEVRYLTGQKYLTLASAPVEVTGVTATVSAPAQVDAGGRFEVQWAGPDNSKDFITIVEKGTAARKYGQYAYTKSGNPVTLPAPEKAGDYEVRYLTGEKYYTLASVPIRVGAVNATVVVQERIKAGSPLEITWTGPDNPRDYLTFVAVGAKKGSYGKYAYTTKGSPVSILAPEVPGKYEARYVTGGQANTLASTIFEVTAVEATLQAPMEVKAGATFEVKWTGPDNPQDFIATALTGSGIRGWNTYVYTYHGQPAFLQAPLEPGDYELRYQTGQKYIVLAKRNLKVIPPDVAPGKLKVIFEKSKPSLAKGAGLEVILDASGSMLQRLDGKRRIHVAKEVLVDMIKNRIPAGSPVALRVFGHREADSCRTDLEMPLGPLNVASTVALIEKIEAKNLAKTPIAASLEQVANDLADISGQRIVVLITDGEETCGGDPAATILQLQEQGIDIRVNIVGFAIDDADLKQTFALWADLGGGNYFDARNANQLSESIVGALQIPFDVLDDAGKIVADGLVGGEAVEVPAGTYQVRTRETPARSARGIVIPPKALETVRLKEN